jgi:hypothetical protein
MMSHQGTSADFVKHSSNLGTEHHKTGTPTVSFIGLHLALLGIVVHGQKSFEVSIAKR